MAKPIILVLPINQTLMKLKEALSQDKDIEFLEAKTLSEAVQFLTARAPALIMTNDPKKCLKFLSTCKSIIKKSSSKTILLTDKPVPYKAMQKMTQWGLADHILEPIQPKSLLYKVNFSLKSLPKKIITDEPEQELKFTKDSNLSGSDEELDVKKKGTKKIDKLMETKESSEKLAMTAEEEERKKKEKEYPIEENNEVKKHASISLDDLSDEEEKEDDAPIPEEEATLTKKKKLSIEELSNEEEVETEEQAPQDELELQKKKKLKVDGEEETLDSIDDLTEEEASTEVSDKTKKIKVEGEEEQLADLPDELEETNTDVTDQSKKLAVEATEEEAPIGEKPDEEPLTEEEKQKASKLDIEDLAEEDQVDVKEEETTEEIKKAQKGKLDLEETEDENLQELPDQENEEKAEKKKLKGQEISVEDLEDLPDEDEIKDEEEQNKEKQEQAKLDLENEKDQNLETQKLQVTPEDEKTADEVLPELDENAADSTHTNLELAVSEEEKSENIEKEVDSDSEEAEKKKKGNLELDEGDSDKKGNLELEVDENGEDLYKREKAGQKELDGEGRDEERVNLELEVDADGTKKENLELDVEGQEGIDWKKRKRPMDDDWTYGKDKTEKFDGHLHGKKLEEQNIDRLKEDLGEQTINYNQIKAEYEEDYDKYKSKKKHWGDKELDSDPAVREKKAADKKAKLEISITETKKEEKKEEEEKEKDVVFDPSTRGLEFAILCSLKYINKDVEAHMILGHLADSLYQEKKGLVTFLLKESGGYRTLFSSHDSGPNSTPEIKSEWVQLREKLIPTLSQVNLPTWGDHTFVEAKNYFIYPLYEGVTELGHALATFNDGGIKTEDDCKLVEVILECSRGIYLNECHNEGKRGNYEEVNRKEEKVEPQQESKGFFSKFIKG